MDKALKKLNEEKNTINADIDMIRLVGWSIICMYNKDHFENATIMMSLYSCKLSLTPGMIFAPTKTLVATKTACSQTS